MQKTTELKEAISELSKSMDELQMVFDSYRKLIAHASQNMHRSLEVLLDKFQCIVEMAYLKNYHPSSFEEISQDILGEINNLVALKEELRVLSDTESHENQSSETRGSTSGI